MTANVPAIYEDIFASAQHHFLLLKLLLRPKYSRTLPGTADEGTSIIRAMNVKSLLGVINIPG